MTMEMSELERIIDERSQKQIESAKETIKKELGSVPQAQIEEAVKKAVTEISAKAEHDKAENVKYLEAFKEAVSGGNSVNAKENGVTIVNQMIASVVAAMGAKDRHNIIQVTPEELLAQAKKDFPYSKALHSVLEARTKTVNATSPTEGGFTVPLAFSGEYIDALVATTLIDKLNIRRVPMVNGNLSIPKMDTTSAVSWGGEEPAGGITEPTFGEVNMRAKKLFAKTAMTNTLIRSSGVNIEGWVAEDLMRKARIALDHALLNGTGSQYQPLGLANNPNVQTTGSSSTAFGLTTPNDMVALLEQANVRMENVHWLFNPIGESWIRNKAFSSGPFAWSDEMARTGKLRGYEFHSSSTVDYNANNGSPYADFWLGDFAEMMFGISKDLSIEVSREGTFTSNGNVISAFDRDLTLIRLIAEVDFDARQPKAFVHGTFSQN